MMQEYDDDFFFEEDKLKSKGSGCRTSKSVMFVDIHETPSLSQAVAPDLDTTEEQNSDDVRNMEDIKEKSDSEGMNQDHDSDVACLTLNHQDLLGMTVTSGSVVLTKDEKNLIGISIGGGAPLCPCLYIVQIFEGTPAARDGTLESGDELVAVNGQSVKGKTKVEVAKMIQAAKEEVTINYNKLHAEPKQGKSLDIVLKKVKHRLVEGMSSGAADALGLSRAILCNDALLAKLRELSDTERMYRDMIDHAKRMLKAYLDVCMSWRALGEALAAVGVREPQPRASAAFTRLAAAHRRAHDRGLAMLRAIKPILSDLSTYLNKAIPDTQMTIRKYADAKFLYLSYCLKVKEMDDEELAYSALREPLYRVETGNYQYRLVLRCRGSSRAEFARRRSDVLAKLELLQEKRSRDLPRQLAALTAHLATKHRQTIENLKENESLFPIEMDLSQNAFQYKSTAQLIQDNYDDEGVEYGKEIEENYDLKAANGKRDETKINRTESRDRVEGEVSTQLLLPGLEEFRSSCEESMALLAELGLKDSAPTDSARDVFDHLLSELSVEK